MSNKAKRDELYRLVTSLFVALIIGVIFPLLIIADAEHVIINTASIGTLFITIISAAKLGYISYKGEILPLALTFWIFVAFWMGLSAFSQTVNNQFPLPGQYTNTNIIEGILIVLLSIIAYETGRKRVGTKNHTLFTSKFELRITPHRVYLLAILSILTSIYAIWKLGGISQVLVTRKEWAFHVFDSGLYSKANALVNMILLRVPAYLALLSALHIWIYRDIYLTSKKSTISHSVVLFYLVLVNALANFPLALARYWLGAMIISIFIVWLGTSNRSMATWSMLLITALLIVFPITSEFRNMNSLKDVGNIELSGITTQLHGGDYDAFQQVLNTVKYVNTEGYSFGTNYLGSLFFWVPRSLWEEKPFGTGQIVAKSMGYDYTNLSQPFWGEAFYAFGYLGVLICLYYYGKISSRLDSLYRSSSFKGSVIFLIVPFFMGFQIFFLRGDLMNGMAYSLPFVLLTVVIFLKKKSIEIN